MSETSTSTSNDAGINAKHRCAQGLIEHEGALAAEPLSSSHHVQPTMTNEDGAADCTLGGHDTGPSREPAVTVVTRGVRDEASATDPRLEPSCPTCLPIVRALAVNYDSANIPEEPVPVQSRV